MTAKIDYTLTVVLLITEILLLPLHQKTGATGGTGFLINYSVLNI